MTVPASKRTQATGEYVHQARIVLVETQRLMRKWPKSRERTETQHVMRIAYEAYTAAYNADVIYASTLEEQRIRMSLLYTAYGRLNALAGLVDLWIDHPPQSGAPHIEPDGTVQYRPVVETRRLRNYAGTLCKAIGVFTGTIRWQREQLNKAKRTEKTAEWTQPAIQ